MVSRTSEAPLYRMNAATPRPIKPSRRVKPDSFVSTVAARTAAVVMTSLRASAAVASRVSDSMSVPILWLSLAIQSLTRMEAASTATMTQLKSTAVGCSTFAKLSFSSSTPMTRIMTETASPARYSYRA